MATGIVVRMEGDLALARKVLVFILVVMGSLRIKG
jgi:hypothetical protein